MSESELFATTITWQAIAEAVAAAAFVLGIITPFWMWFGNGGWPDK